MNVLVQNYFTDADPAMLLSELGLSEPEVTSPLDMSFAARAASTSAMRKDRRLLARSRHQARP